MSKIIHFPSKADVEWREWEVTLAEIFVKWDVSEGEVKELLSLTKPHWERLRAPAFSNISLPIPGALTPAQKLAIATPVQEGIDHIMSEWSKSIAANLVIFAKLEFQLMRVAAGLPNPFL